MKKSLQADNLKRNAAGSLWTIKERAAWEPQPPLSVAEWAQAKVRLTRKMGAQVTGRYRTALTPWVTEIFEAFEELKREGIAWVASAQIGKSLTCQILIDYLIDCDPQNILYFMDTDTNAKWASTHRVQPIIDANPSVRDKVAVPHKRQKLEIEFDGGTLSLAGANSVSQLGNKSAPIVIRDETSKWREKLGAEAGALEAAGERVAGQYFFKLIDISTPVQVGDPILKQFEASDKRYYHLPCPLCGAYQRLIWQQVKWAKDAKTGKSDKETVRGNTWYECVKCKGRITEKSKRWMLAGGRWVKDGQKIVAEPVETKKKKTKGNKGKRGTSDVGVSREGPPVAAWSLKVADGEYIYRIAGESPFKPIAGFHISRLYSPFRSWGQLAEQWLGIGDDLSKRQIFYNAVLAEPWRQRTLSVAADKIMDHIEPGWPRGVVPAGYDIILLGADVQYSFTRWSVWAFRQDKARHLVDNGEVARPQNLDSILNLRFQSAAGGEPLPVAYGFIDSGYHTSEVYEFCRGRPNIMAVKGGATMSRGLVSVGRVDKYPGSNKAIPGGLQLGLVVSDAFKDELFTCLEEGWEDRSKPPPERYVSFHADTDEKFLASLTAEERIERQDIRGRVKYVWKVRRKDNHDLDTSVYAAAAFNYILGGVLAARRQAAKKLARRQPAAPDDIEMAAGRSASGRKQGGFVRRGRSSRGRWIK